MIVYNQLSWKWGKKIGGKFSFKENCKFCIEMKSSDCRIGLCPMVVTCSHLYTYDFVSCVAHRCNGLRHTIGAKGQMVSKVTFEKNKV